MNEQRFNSTMVRLKVQAVKESSFQLSTFQFHNGSIKSVKGRLFLGA